MPATESTAPRVPAGTLGVSCVLGAFRPTDCSSSVTARRVDLVARPRHGRAPTGHLRWTSCRDPTSGPHRRCPGLVFAASVHEREPPLTVLRSWTRHISAGSESAGSAGPRRRAVGDGTRPWRSRRASRMNMSRSRQVIRYARDRAKTDMLPAQDPLIGRPQTGRSTPQTAFLSPTGSSPACSRRKDVDPIWRHMRPLRLTTTAGSDGDTTGHLCCGRTLA